MEWHDTNDNGLNKKTTMIISDQDPNFYQKLNNELEKGAFVRKEKLPLLMEARYHVMPKEEVEKAMLKDSELEKALEADIKQLEQLQADFAVVYGKWFNKSSASLTADKLPHINDVIKQLNDLHQSIDRILNPQVLI